jgi:predicted nuclease of predicted toxin-antitoxin system
MRFLVDAQLPPALARTLATGGHEAEHVADIGLGGAKDQTIWEYAARVGAVIVSKYEDFAQRTFFGKGGPRVVWIRLPNARKRELPLWFEPILPRIIEALKRSERLIEIA